MTEIALIWDRPLLFEKLFVEYGLECERVSPLQVGSPYSPRFRLAILPVGFANPVYTTVAKTIKSLSRPLLRFVRKGGSLIAFSPYVDGYDYTWLDLQCHFKLITRTELMELSVKREHPAAQIADILEAQTDGYLSGGDESDVILTSTDGPVLTVTPIERGRIVLSTVHEFPARQFIEWALDAARIETEGEISRPCWSAQTHLEAAVYPVLLMLPVPVRLCESCGEPW